MLSTTLYPTVQNGFTYGWAQAGSVQSSDRAQTDPRLAGIAFATNGTPATFYVDLPAAQYDISLALGDYDYTQCWTMCELRLYDGNTPLWDLKSGKVLAANYYDAQGDQLTSQQWITSNASRRINVTSGRLTIMLGADSSNGDITPLAYFSVASVPGFKIGATFTVGRGSSTGLYGLKVSPDVGFNDSIVLSVDNLPAGVSAAFTPATIPPGQTTASMTLKAAANAQPGTYLCVLHGKSSAGESTSLMTVLVQ